MPILDVYAAIGTFPDAAQLAKDLAAAVMAVEGVPNIPMFRKNTDARMRVNSSGASCASRSRGSTRGYGR